MFVCFNSFVRSCVLKALCVCFFKIFVFLCALIALRVCVF